MLKARKSLKDARKKISEISGRFNFSQQTAVKGSVLSAAQVLNPGTWEGSVVYALGTLLFGLGCPELVLLSRGLQVR